MAGQLNLFDDPDGDEQPATIVEPEYVESPAHKRTRKPRATYDEFFENLPAHKVYVDTLTDEQKKSYSLVIRTGEDGDVPIIIFNYTPTRSGYNAANFLKGAKPGYYLMVDGYQGYNKVPEAKRCCCYTHIRRLLA